MAIRRAFSSTATGKMNFMSSLRGGRPPTPWSVHARAGNVGPPPKYPAVRFGRRVDLRAPAATAVGLATLGLVPLFVRRDDLLNLGVIFRRIVSVPHARAWGALRVRDRGRTRRCRRGTSG